MRKKDYGNLKKNKVFSLLLTQMVIREHRKQGGAHSPPRQPAIKTWLEGTRRTKDHILRIRSCCNIEDADKERLSTYWILCNLGPHNKIKHLVVFGKRGMWG